MGERSRGPAGLLIVVWVLGGLGASGLLTPGDPAAAEALWAWARTEAGADLAAPAYLDAARAAARIRPWQEGHERARARVRAVDQARREALRR